MKFPGCGRAGALAMAMVLLFTASPAHAGSRHVDAHLWSDGNNCTHLTSTLDDESAGLFTWARASYLTKFYWSSPCGAEGYTGVPGEVQVRTDVFVWNHWAQRWEWCYAGPWENSIPDYGMVTTSYWWSKPPCGANWYLINSAAWHWRATSEGYKAYGGWKATGYMWIGG